MITLGKKYQTKDGRRVRILAIDVRDGFDGTEVVGLVPAGKGDLIVTWDMYGNSHHEAFLSLVPVPTKREMWFTFDEHFVIEKPCFDTEGEAKANAVRSDSHVAHVTWEG